jgi:2-oxoglutarate dehydrogenase E2 component (dihydrolipoamide succinyltransferase)
MAIEIRVPALPESVADATIIKWHKKAGDTVKRDETLVDLETDKVVLEVPAPDSGVLAEILKQEGSTVLANDLLGKLNAGAVTATTAAPAAATTANAANNTKTTPAQALQSDMPHLSPAVRRAVAEGDVNVQGLQGSGKGGRLVKEDLTTPATASKPMGLRSEERVPMTRLRAKIAERLVEAQHTAAMLTTFNEVNMQAVMDLRNRYKDQFEKTHGVKLGFMSFFTKAVVEALKKFPDVNASIDGQEIIYHGYYDVGIAVSTPRGLVVPIIRNAETLSLADIERSIAESALKARDGKLTVEEMTGGTFTITNGGVFGSLMATPIINPPQSGILGMHKIEERPIAENGQVVIRPMMYVALSYDHRIIDGRESVGFLVAVKQFLEDPARMLLAL